MLKTIIRDSIPPIALNAIRSVRTKLSHQDFKSWWAKYDKSTLPDELVAMVDYFITTPDYDRLTEYWRYLNRQNIAQIAEQGLDNYRQTVAKNYFTWVGNSLENSYTRNILNAKYSQIPISQLLRKHDLFTLDESIQHNLVTFMLYEYVVSTGLIQLDESGQGNPPSIEIHGKQVSQDILNSTLEYRSVAPHLPDNPRILEVGAGSGRSAYAFIKLANAKYIIADVPPALYISQHFLSSQFPDKKIFRFRPFDNYADIAEEFEQSDIAFLMPHQLDLINTKVDMFMAIDCLHEMNPPQVEFYFQQAERLADKIYFKCWMDTNIPFDDIKWDDKSYPVRESWKQEFWRQTVVPADFFEAMFNMHSAN